MPGNTKHRHWEQPALRLFQNPMLQARGYNCECECESEQANQEE
ncbi:hypothetical protein VDGD_21517 [Verticillium dahliae]|nr:hypothetical protein VDGD_21517 [Verticillium dahliae]